MYTALDLSAEAMVTKSREQVCIRSINKETENVAHVYSNGNRGSLSLLHSQAQLKSKVSQTMAFFM